MGWVAWRSLPLLFFRWNGPRRLAERAMRRPARRTRSRRSSCSKCTLPRTAVAILAGAALGLAGLLLQRVLRNPLAEPSTLGISAGAQLAMALATFSPPL